MSYLDAIIIIFALISVGTTLLFWIRQTDTSNRTVRFFNQLHLPHLIQTLAETPVRPARSVPHIQAPKGDVEKELLKKNSALLRANRSLVQSKTQLRRLVEKLYDIKEKEGIRVARELHDELGQILTGLKIEVTLLQRNIQKSCPDNPVALSLAEETLTLVGQSITRVQKLSKELRPPMLDKLGLIATFESITAEVSRQTGIHCQLDYPELDESLTTEVLTYGYRIFKETIFALAAQNNVSKINVCVEQVQNSINIRITDDGRRPQRELFGDGSVGILGMTEYARKYGGTFSIGPHHDGGNEVFVMLPIKKAAES